MQNFIVASVFIVMLLAPCIVATLTGAAETNEA